MRVIAGKFRRRPLHALRGLAVRPTSDRLRETLFNILGSRVENSLFVDVFAGTGAVGIEAVSRGARHVYFIEKHPAATKLIAANLVSLQALESADVVTADALRGLAELVRHGARADLVFLDPPYAKENDYASVLDFLGEASLVAPDGQVIAEHTRRVILAEAYGNLSRVRIVAQGDARLSFYVTQRAKTLLA